MSKAERPAPAGPRAWELLAATGVMLAGVAAMVRDSLRTPADFAEICVTRMSDPPLPQVLAIVRDDIHPPLTFLLRHAWSGCFGDGDGVQRALSILVAAWVPVFVWRSGQRLFGTGVGLLAAALTALHPALVPFGQAVDVWPFEWLCTYAALHFALAWFERRRTRDAAGWIAVAALTSYTSYVATAMVIAIAAATALRLRGDRAGLRTWLALQLVPIAAALPQLATFRHQFAREGSARFFHFPTPAQLEHLIRITGYHTFRGALVGGLLAAFALVRTRSRRRVALVLSLAAVPLVLKRVWVVILPPDAFVVIPLLLMAAAAGFAQLPWRAVRWAGGTVALVLALVAAWRAAPSDEVRGAAGALERVREAARPGDVVVHAESHTLLFFLHHAPELRSRLLLRDGERVHYAEGGLVIPDSVLWRARDFDAAAAAGTRLWCVDADRAAVRSGVASRAGAWAVARFHAAAPTALWRRAPVELRVVTPSP